MKSLPLIFATLCLSGLAAETPAVTTINSFAGPEDFSWVKREIKKAPEFKSQKVRYLFWVLGDGKKSVMAFAWDESEGTGKGYDTLYVDRNFNGDLTEEGKRLFWKHLEPGEKGRLPVMYDIPNIKEADGDKTFSMHFESHAGPDYLGYSSALNVSWPKEKGYGIHLHNALNWSNDVKTAPIYHWGGTPVPFINGKAPGESIGTWEAGTSVDAWYQISFVGDTLKNVLNFPYGSYPGGLPTTSIRLLNPDGSTKGEVAMEGGCACGGGYGHHLQLSFRLPPGKHVLVSRIPRADYLGGPAEYLYPVEIKNPDFGKPLADPAFAALKASNSGSAVKFVSLRRASTAAQLEKGFPDENPVAARVSDTSLQTDWAEGGGVTAGCYGEAPYLELGDRPKNTMPFTQRFLLKFDLSGFDKQNTKILGAMVRLTMPRMGTTAPNAKAQAFAVRRDWNELKLADGYACWWGPKFLDKNPASVTWGKPGCEDTQTDRFPEPAAACDIGGFPAKLDPKDPKSDIEARRLFALDITDLAKKWLSGELPNNGIVVMLSGSGGPRVYSSETEELTFRPTLVVAYEGADAQPNFTPPPGEDLNQAISAAKTLNRPLLVKFYSPNCGVCKKVQTTTFAEKSVTDVLAGKFSYVNLKIEDHAQLAQTLGVGAVPTVVILAPDGKTKTGFIESAQLLDSKALLKALEIKN